MNDDWLAVDLPFEISKAVRDARIMRGLTQKQVAQKANTKKTAIARLESGNTIPELAFLIRVMDALDMSLALGFVPKENKDQVIERITG